jgi:hypothetical protein
MGIYMEDGGHGLFQGAKRFDMMAALIAMKKLIRIHWVSG